MKITAVFDNSTSIHFIVKSGIIVGQSFKYIGRRPNYFIIPKGLSDEEINYLKDYCGSNPRY